jgi:hypothetical protein
VDMCQPSTPASWGPTRATDKAGQFIDLEEQKQEPGRSAPAARAPQNDVRKNIEEAKKKKLCRSMT